MSDEKRIFCSWQVAEDGSGDIIINIPPEIADALKLRVGNVLTSAELRYQGGLTLKVPRSQI